MIDSTDDPNAPIPCPTCNRPIPVEELRCRFCGTRLDVYSADAEELDFSGDGDEWEDESTPDRGFVIFARVVAGLGIAGGIGWCCYEMSRQETVWDQIAVSMIGLIFGALLLRPIKMLFLGA